MSITNVLIIEDEKLNADRLKRLLREIKPSIQILDVLDNIADSINWFQGNESPDLVMMDIRLSDGLSFEILESIKIDCPIIFTTAFDEYAVRAFKFNSIDYLLKPVEKKELENALIKLDSLKLQQTNQDPIRGLLDFIYPKDFRTRFLLPYKDGYKTILVEDIQYFYSEFKLTHAKLKCGTVEIVPQTLEELEQQLNSKVFFRANRQFIVHIDAIKRLHNHFNGKLKVEIKYSEDVEILVSREKAQLLKNWLDY
ncbi:MULTISPECIES: LytR/AlgR family response regulator transcription factor [Sphingobacterium]|uniref:DNA-binding response regulator n=1 Tax=Sphingobacterium athyrii TaxID=2152717 RepID=A0A363NYP0_9SPHI|nr:MULTISPECIES: LytTR family DNA-binding domain-containing protein [Sphingobacterium]PUV25857.1 DNA-binding response regulator [Sphingobacterium athyrii]QIH33266.1 response regulator transcription factor [Sphingobacterium sp. DR205]